MHAQRPMSQCAWLCIATVAVGIAARRLSPNASAPGPRRARRGSSCGSKPGPKPRRRFSRRSTSTREFEDAYYGLGLANMRMKKYGEAHRRLRRNAAISTRRMAGKQFTNRQDAQRYRQDRLTEIDEVIRQSQTGPQTARHAGPRCANCRNSGARFRSTSQRGSNIERRELGARVRLPGARQRLLPDRAVGRRRARIQGRDRRRPQVGRSPNNLAVVYLQTGRYKEADDAVKSAEKAGFKVHPQLKQDIKAKLGIDGRRSERRHASSRGARDPGFGAAPSRDRSR